MKKKKTRRKLRKYVLPSILILLILITASIGVALYMYIEGNKSTTYYIGNNEPALEISDKDGNTISIYRGTSVEILNRTAKTDEKEYRIFKYNGKEYYIDEYYLKNTREECVYETGLITLRNYTSTKSYDSYEIASFYKANTTVNITGYHNLNEDGTIDYYQVDNNGYIPSKYLSDTYYETAYDSSVYRDTIFYSGGDPTLISYYPKEDIFFENNIMPDKVKALYINAEAVYRVDSYIELAKGSSINAFVVDIKDCYVDTQLAYESPVMRQYAPSTDNVVNSFENYQAAMKKIKDNGFYLIGRITAFKDDAFASDNPEEAILNSDGSLYHYGYVAWPSIYSRKVWEYDVALANEAIDNFGFDEIQFDYCRFPEYVDDYCNTHNTYNETPSQAITEFLRYATEQLHNKETYISADVFGEISGWDPNEYTAFVTSYGQFWCAISNVVDVISSMPYPDHFANYAYGISEPWANPGEIIYAWGRATRLAQDKTYDPAKCRTWIQAQYSDPYDVDYTPQFVKDQIDSLTRANINDGYLTWNAASNYNSYSRYIDIFE
ncbi:MAG: putative glycoside hydrolase [Erysipelotrichaceae bacterium]|nr:putative glycoside hydrolase [Erysipelotrichaceae bacterium]